MILKGQLRYPRYTITIWVTLSRNNWECSQITQKSTGIILPV